MPDQLSPIHKKFVKACLKPGITFDTEEQVSRYRVDCIDKSRNLVIELDGHEHHKSKEDRTNDAKRDRKLHREGYTVLRFTGTEIWNNVDSCVNEIKQTISLMKPQPHAVGAIYIDWMFLDRTSVKALHYYGRKYPDKNLEHLTLTQFLDFIAGYLNLKGRYDVHLFGIASSFSTSIVDLNALKLRKKHKAIFNITEHQHEWLAIELVEHLHKKGTKYDNLIMIADDSAYPPLLDRGRKFNILFRKDNDSTSMAMVQTEKWQDIDYVIGGSMGLETYEL